MSAAKCRLAFCCALPSHGAESGLCILHGFMFARSAEAKVAAAGNIPLSDFVKPWCERIEREFGEVRP